MCYQLRDDNFHIGHRIFLLALIFYFHINSLTWETQRSCAGGEAAEAATAEVPCCAICLLSHFYAQNWGHADLKHWDNKTPILFFFARNTSPTDHIRSVILSGLICRTPAPKQNIFCTSTAALIPPKFRAPTTYFSTGHNATNSVGSRACRRWRGAPL